METKNCCNHDHHGVNVCVHVDGCCTNGDNTSGEEKPQQTPCACVSRLVLTIGKGGQFVTLTEALEYADTVVHNTLIIEMLSDVTETRTNAIFIDGFGNKGELSTGSVNGISSLVLKGNGHTLNLNSITDLCAIGFFSSGKGWFDNIVIIAENVTRGVIDICASGFLYIRKDVKLIGNPTKTTNGIVLYRRGYLCITDGNSVLENFDCGIIAYSLSWVDVTKANLTFTNVTTNYNPAPNTEGNGNAYIYIE